MACKINKIVIWGHKFHRHTHSYIHNGYYKAFKKLGYKVEWYGNDDDVTNVDFSNSLFITEHQGDEKMPIRNDCLYVIHNIDNSTKKYDIPDENIINLKCSHRDNDMCNNVRTFNEIEHSFYGHKKHIIYFTLWATDLFPEEINENIKNIDSILKKRDDGMFYHIGMASQTWLGIMNHLHYDLGLNIRHLGGVWQDKPEMDEYEAMEFTQKSVLPLALQDIDQIKLNYVPCRIFKNISYGRMGVTNNPFVNTFFDNKLVYNSDIKQCIQQAIKFESLPVEKRKTRIVGLMEKVRDHHTYINRVEDLCNFISIFTNFVFVK
jgi:hypothetical protein